MNFPPVFFEKNMNEGLVKTPGAWYYLDDFDKMRENGVFQNL